MEPTAPPPFPAANPVWQKKKRFWGVNILLSSLVSVGLPVGAMIWFFVEGFNLASSGPNMDPDKVSSWVTQTMVATMFGSLIILFGLIWLGVSITMFCLVPKPYSGMIR